MTAAELKASILDRAVRGELTAAWRTECEAKGEVERRETRDARGRETRDTPPSDVSRLTSSPAVSSLASRVSRPTPGPTPIADPPYDLPQGWVWKRGKDIGTMERGSGIKRNETVAEGLPCLRYGEIYTSYTHYLDKAKSFVPAALFKACKHIKKNDLVFTLTGENEVDIAKTLAYLGDEEIAAGGDLAIWSNHNCFAPYLAYMMAAPSIIKQKAQSATGNFIVHTSTKKIGEIMIPLPPLAEQKRIVAKIEELMPLVEEYGKAETELAALNDNFPTALRKSILQHAVEGRLTATWREAHGLASPSVSRPLASPVSRLASKTPSPAAPPETAADLLAKIAAEKKSLLAAGKIKKSKPLPPITDDEKPFAIPETWAWVRLGDVCHIERGGSPRPISAYITKDANGINWIKIGDTEQGGMYINKAAEKIKPSGLNKTRLVEPGDFLLTNSMSFGRPYICKINGAIHDGWLRLHFVENTFDEVFMFWLLSSPFVFDQFDYLASGSGVRNLKIDKAAIVRIPLPPLAEQKAIVARVEELLKLVEEMKE